MPGESMKKVFQGMLILTQKPSGNMHILSLMLNQE